MRAGLVGFGRFGRGVHVQLSPPSSRPLLPSSLRTQGPIRRDLTLAYSRRDLPEQQTTGIMGPRVRGDDNDVVTSPLTTRPSANNRWCKTPSDCPWPWLRGRHIRPAG